MSDQFNVSAAYDKSSYVGGDPIKITISGSDVQTVVSQSQVGPLDISLIAADGAKTTIHVPAEQATITTVTPQSVVIDTSAPIVDGSPNPRVWTVSADKLSISAVA